MQALGQCRFEAANHLPGFGVLRCHRLSLALSSLLMVDIHCHILSGLDDGAESLDMSVAMAEMAIEDGITHIVATPHASPNHEFIPELVRMRRDEIQSRFEGRLTLATGCDFHLSFENLQDIRLNPSRFTINQNNYLLVEFADFSVPPSMDNALHELQLAGLTPIITHPERNPLIRTKPERLFRWLRQGCYVQVTAQSLLGRFGKAAKASAEEWINAGAVHFLASDAHNITSRPLRLSEGFEYLQRTRGEEIARALLLDNPMAAFEGRPLPFVPELDEDAGLAPGANSPRRRKRFWIF